MKEKKDKDLHEDMEVVDAEVVEDLPKEGFETQADAESAEAESDANSQLKKEYDELRERYLRLQADFQNYKRRAEEDKKNTIKFATESLVVKLLEVSDDFDRALALEVEHDAFYEGMKLVDGELMRILEQNGLELIETDGQPFDPNLHHAVVTEDSDEYDSETITETFQKGFKLNGKVVRPAMVKVAK